MRSQFALILSTMFVVCGAFLVLAWHPTQNLQADNITPAEPLNDSLPAPAWEQDVQLTAVDGVAADYCEFADELDVPGSDASDVTFMTIDQNDDQPLSCIQVVPTSLGAYEPPFASPYAQTGYRTVWYKFISPHTGQITVRTEPMLDNGENYDTVLTVYKSNDGTCDTLTELACNDDDNALLSRVTIPVHEGHTYYIKVADRNQSVQGSAHVGVSITPHTTINGLLKHEWELMASLPTAVTRHNTVAVDHYIYVIGGQRSVDTEVNTLERTGEMWRYNTKKDNWIQLASLPGPDGFGYSETTAVHSKGKIYVPIGYVGGHRLSGVDDTHWVYDIESDTWSSSALSWANDPHVQNLSLPLWAVAIPDPIEGYYLVGGSAGGDILADGTIALSHMVRFSDNGNFPDDWTRKADMPTGRYAHTADYIQKGAQQLICVVGGLTTEGLLTDGVCYDINANSWNTAIPSLNIPRFMHSSAVDSQGNWYVFGGRDINQDAIPEIERFSFETNRWDILPLEYNLELQHSISNLDRPARVTPGGVMINDTLWAVGGETDPSNFTRALSTVERIFLPSEYTYIPMLYNSNEDGDNDPGDTFSSAVVIKPGVQYSADFAAEDDIFDTYKFTVKRTRTVQISLYGVVLGDDYELSLYDSNKRFLGAGNAIGNRTETITRQLPAGDYYAIAMRKVDLPTNGDNKYRITHGNLD